MNTKTRKILSRVGAGLMLGLSLFNLGAAWQKGGGTELPNRARQIRKRETENLKKETQQLAEVAEQEGRAVIAQQQTMQEQQIKIAGEQLTTAQLAVRFVAIAAWGVTASVFFASMLFNVPFALGKAVLSLLPGVPHTSMLSLQADQLSYQENEPIRVLLKLDSDNDPVSLVKAAIVYDAEKLKFDHYEVDPALIDQVKRTQTEEGRVILTLEKKQPEAAVAEEPLANLYFTTVSEGQARVELDKEASLVVMPKDGKQYNILGDTENTRLRITKPSLAQINCEAMEDGTANQLTTWQALVVDNLLPDEKQAWVTIDQQRAIQCHYDSQNVYLVFSGISYDKPRLQLNQAGEKIVIDSNDNQATWENSGRGYYVLPIKRESINQTNFVLQLESEEDFRWPAKGQGQFSLN